MKYIALFAGAAAAATISDLESAIATIQTNVNSLNTAISGYSAGNIAALASANSAVLTAIGNADSVAKSITTPFTDTEAVGLAGPIQSLGTSVQTAITNIDGKHDQIVADCNGQTIYAGLVSQQTASNSLTTDILKLIPSDLSSTANSLAAPISKALDTGVQTYSDEKNGNTGANCGASSSASSPASSSASAPVSSSSSGSSSTVVGGGVPVSSSSATTTAASSSVSAAPTGATNGTTLSTSAHPTSTTVATGAAPTAAAGFGVAVLAGLAALAL